MNAIIRNAIERPVAVMAMMMLVVLFGVVALRTIPIQLSPDIEKPNTAVEHSYFIVGNKDEFLSSELLENELLVYQNLGFKTIQFEGNHDIEPKTLNSLLKSF